MKLAKPFTDQLLEELRKLFAVMYKGGFSHLMHGAFVENAALEGDQLCLARGYSITQKIVPGSIKGASAQITYAVEMTYQISPATRDEPAQHDSIELGKVYSLAAALGVVVGSEVGQHIEWWMNQEDANA